MHPDGPLSTTRLQRATLIAQAQPWRTDPVTLDSEALSVMTDLTQVKAATTSPGTTLREAEQIMIYQGVRMLFVVTEMPSLLGLITTNDLYGDRTLRIVQQRNVRYEEITVADVMVDVAALEAIDFAQLQQATVRNVVATLKQHGRNHLLIVETVSRRQQMRTVEQQRVRGVVSRAQVERQLGGVIDMVEVARSFADIEKALY